MTWEKYFIGLGAAVAIAVVVVVVGLLVWMAVVWYQVQQVIGKGISEAFAEAYLRDQVEREGPLAARFLASAVGLGASPDGSGRLHALTTVHTWLATIDQFFSRSASSLPPRYKEILVWGDSGSPP